MSLIDNLKLRLEALNPASFNGGASWLDLSGNGNNVTLSASQAVPSYGIVFNGSNHGEAPNAASLNFGIGDFTILHKTKHPVMGASALGAILSKGAKFDSPLPGYILNSHAGAPVFNVLGSTSTRSEYYSAIYTWSDSRLQGLMRVSGYVYCILDGIKYGFGGVLGNYVGSNYFPDNLDNTTNLSIGRNGSYGADWTGEINSVYMWNRSLTDEELLLMNEESPFTSTSNQNKSNFLQFFK